MSYANEPGVWLNPNPSGDMIIFTRVPLPALAKQRRIVAKVNQLMAQVDELERQQEAFRENASKLLDAIVQELTNGGRSIAATLESRSNPGFGFSQ